MPVLDDTGSDFSGRGPLYDLGSVEPLSHLLFSNSVDRSLTHGSR